MSSEPEKLRKYFDKAKEFAAQAGKEPANAAAHLEEAKKYLKWANKYTETDSEKAEAAQVEQLIQQAEGAGSAKPAEEAAGPNPEKTKKYLSKAREALEAATKDPAKAQENLDEAKKYVKWANKYMDDSLKAEVVEVQAAYDQAAGGGAPPAPAPEAPKAPEVAAPPAVPAPVADAAQTAAAPAPAGESPKPAEEAAGPNPEKAKKYLGKTREAIAAAEKEPAKASEQFDEARKYLKWASKYADEAAKAEVAQVQADLDKATAPKPDEKIKPVAKPADAPPPAKPKSEMVHGWAKFLPGKKGPTAPASGDAPVKAPAVDAKQLQDQAGKALGDAASKVSEALKSQEAQKAMEDQGFSIFSLAQTKAV